MVLTLPGRAKPDVHLPRLAWPAWAKPGLAWPSSAKPGKAWPGLARAGLRGPKRALKELGPKLTMSPQMPLVSTRGPKTLGAKPFKSPKGLLRAYVGTNGPGPKSFKRLGPSS